MSCLLYFSIFRSTTIETMVNNSRIFLSDSTGKFEEIFSDLCNSSDISPSRFSLIHSFFSFMHRFYDGHDEIDAGKHRSTSVKIWKINSRLWHSTEQSSNTVKRWHSAIRLIQTCSFMAWSLTIRHQGFCLSSSISILDRKIFQTLVKHPIDQSTSVEEKQRKKKCSVLFDLLILRKRENQWRSFCQSHLSILKWNTVLRLKWTWLNRRSLLWRMRDLRRLLEQRQIRLWKTKFWFLSLWWNGSSNIPGRTPFFSIGSSSLSPKRISGLRASFKSRFSFPFVFTCHLQIWTDWSIGKEKWIKDWIELLRISTIFKDW